MAENSDPLHAVIPILKERERLADERVDELKQQLVDASEELADARGALAHIERLAGIDRPAPKNPIPNPWVEKLVREAEADGPEGLEAVGTALLQSPAPLTLTELTEAVAALGWRPATDFPERAVRAAANRLRRKDTNFDYDRRVKKFAFLPRHKDQLPPMLGGVGDFTNPENDD